MYEKLKSLHRLFWVLVGFVIAILSLAVLALGILIGIALYGAKTGALERWVSQGVGAPIQFTLSGFSWKGSNPELTLSHIQVENPKTHQITLTLAHAAVQINAWQSLKTQSLVTTSLSISGLHYSVSDTPLKIVIQELTLKSLSPRVWAVNGNFALYMPKLSIPLDLTGVLEGDMTDPQSLSANVTLKSPQGGVVGIQMASDPHARSRRVWHVQVSGWDAQNLHDICPELFGTLTSLTLTVLENEADPQQAWSMETLSGVISNLGILPTSQYPGLSTQTLMIHADAQGLELIFPEQAIKVLPPLSTSHQTPLLFQLEAQVHFEPNQTNNAWKAMMQASLSQSGLSSRWNGQVVFPDLKGPSFWKTAQMTLTSDTLWNQPLENFTQDLLSWNLFPQSFTQQIATHQVSLAQIHIQTQYQEPLSQISQPNQWQMRGGFSGLNGVFLQGWPSVQQVAGEVNWNVNSPGLRITATQGTSLGMHLNQLAVTFDPLTLSIQATGSVLDGEAYMAHTPLASSLAPLFQSISIKGGEVTADIGYQPQNGWLTHLDFQGISSAHVQSLPGLPLTNLSGRLVLRNQWISKESYFQGEFLQRPLHLRLESDSNQVNIKAEGEAPIGLLAAQFPNTLWKSLSGVVPFEIQFIQAGFLRVIAHLSLTHVQSTLPGPLAKPFGQPLNLTASVSWQPGIPRWTLGVLLENPQDTQNLLSLQGFANPNLLHLTVQSPIAQGVVNWQWQNAQRSTPASLTCQLQTLQLTAQEFKNKNNKNKDKKLLNITSWPSIDCQVADFYWNQGLLGQLDLQLVHFAPKTLEIRKLSLQSDSFNIHITGEVRASSQRLVSQYSLETNSENWGWLLAQLGFKGILSGGKGILSGHLTYESLDLMPVSQTLSAQFIIDLQDGSLSSINPGMTRFLGLLNVSDITRRLDLDFSDIQDKGLAFNHLTGTVDTQAGVLSTHNLVMEGPALNLHLQGNTSIVSHSLDFQVLMMPHMSGGLALAATLLGGPIAGAATWVADKVLSDTVLKDKGFLYQISGTWEKPEISSLQN